jgi:hypothetical protein
MTAPAVKPAQSASKWSIGSALWLVALTIMASFQTWRGAYEDGVLFYGIVILLTVDQASGQRIGSRLQRLRIPKMIILGVTALCGVVLVIAPRHGIVTFTTMSIIGVMMLILAWPPLEASRSRSTPAIRRSAW